MEGREVAPKSRDMAVLSTGTNVGRFWNGCKDRRLCGRPPYDRLLVNPVLRADYRTVTAAVRESDGRTQAEEGEARDQGSGGTGTVVRFRVDQGHSS